MCRAYSYHNHTLSQLGVFADDGRVDVLAEDRLVVIDVSQVDVHSSHVTERRWAAVCGLYGDVVFMGDFIVQGLNHKDVAWEQNDASWRLQLIRLKWVIPVLLLPKVFSMSFSADSCLKFGERLRTLSE